MEENDRSPVEDSEGRPDDRVHSGAPASDASVGLPDRTRAEEALRLSEERYRLLVESAQEYAIFMIDRQGHISTWNTGAERIFGYTEQEALGRPAAVIFTQEDRAAGVPEAEMAKAARDDRAFDDRWHVRKDGSRFWASGAMETLRHPDGQVGGFAKVLRDNTERKQAEEALEKRVAERTQQVRELASRLTMAEQEERRRVSQILHDDLQQLLYGVEMKMSMIRRQLQEVGRPDLTEALEEIRSWIVDAITTTRQLTVDLSPPILQKEGLTEALEWLRRQMQELHGLEVTIEADHTGYIADDDLRVLLFQAVRELLFNVKKHAGTDRAAVRILKEEGHLVIEVIDEGVGFDVDEVAARDQSEGGFGLFSVRERLRLLGGRMEVESRPGEGTRIALHVPVSPLPRS